MTLRQWADNGWLKSHKTSAAEIGNLLAIVDRDLKDAVETWLEKEHPNLA